MTPKAVSSCGATSEAYNCSKKQTSLSHGANQQEIIKRLRGTNTQSWPINNYTIHVISFRNMRYAKKHKNSMDKLEKINSEMNQILDLTATNLKVVIINMSKE